MNLNIFVNVRTTLRVVDETLKKRSQKKVQSVTNELVTFFSSLQTTLALALTTP